ncbi:MAG: amidase [Acidobacteria bacterium]|nr:amidase [Acidobacteriota bacterium]
MRVPGLLSRYLNGDLTAADFQKRIEANEPKIHAWVETRLEPANGDGPLLGAPYGVKDIIETAGYTCAYGSPLYAGNVASADATLVQQLRRIGGRVMGKTQTTSFAYFDSAPTRNPRKHSHTPGGSSSGSAAAVAAGMVPFAIGSQTQGSIIRPASYCGVVGLKPTFGVLPLNGFMPFAPSLDTAGFFTETALDMRLLWRLLGLPADAELPLTYGMVEFDAEPEMLETFRGAVQTLGHYGCKVKRFPAPDSFAQSLDAVRAVQCYEGARSLREQYERHGNAVGRKLAELIRNGLAMPEEQYLQSLATLDHARADMASVFAEFSVILSAAAVGPAPQGFSTTGDPRNNAHWTGLYTPAISIPMPVPEGQLPMGLQMSAAPGADALLLQAACHCEALFHAASGTGASQ